MRRSARWSGCSVLFVVALSACGDDPRPTTDAIADDTVADTDTVFDDARDADAETLDPDAIDGAGDLGPDALTPDTIAPPPLDPDLGPCEQPLAFPLTLVSATRPLTLHYREASDRAVAETALGHLEFAWGALVDDLGFRPPLSDGGECGTDDRFDAFLWRDSEDTYVDVLDPNPSTPIDDWSAFMVVDAWGEFAGDMLDATLAHELSHACQAAYDWGEGNMIYEASATFIEDLVHDDDNNYMFILDDFQRRPEWALDHDDRYATFYMYGAALYLHYLYERFFPTRPGFIAELWQRLESPAGDNEPDWIDAVDGLLLRARSSFIDSLVEFARWRYYVASRADGRHLSEAAEFPESASVKIAQTLDAARGDTVTVRPMLTGMAYVEVTGPGDSAVIKVEYAASDLAVVVQALPGLADDGDLVHFDLGRATLPLIGGKRLLAFVALPPLGDADPDERDDTRFPIKVTVSLPP